MTDVDIPIESIRKELQMSRVEFLDFLNDDSSGNRLVTSMEEDFRIFLDENKLNGCRGARFFSVHHLEYITVEHLDYERWKKNKDEFEEISKWKKSSSIVEDGFVFLRELYEQQANTIISLSKEIKNKNERIEILERQLQGMSTGTASCDGRGLASIVCRLRREGKTEEELAMHFHDDGKWCSQAQVGALLHPDESMIASESMGQRARRLLGKI